METRRIDTRPGSDALRRAVFESPGSTEPAVRAAAGSGAELPEPLGSYAATVRDRSYRITDTDLAGLTAAGLSDDDIFEITSRRPSAPRCSDSTQECARSA